MNKAAESLRGHGKQSKLAQVKQKVDITEDEGLQEHELIRGQCLSAPLMIYLSFGP